MSETEQFQPKIVGFFCNWCSYRAADGAGIARTKYDTNVRVIRVMCSGRVDPQFIFRAFAMGADGVMIAGCHPGECHYVDQNYKTMRRVAMLESVLDGFGINQRRIRLQWASAAEGNILANAINEMVADVRKLGPLNWSEQCNTQDPAELEASLQAIADEHAAVMEVSR